MFSRQITIDGWNQEAIENNVCLCLGIGGIGSNICIELLRLGVKKIIIVDNDKVEESNINRQIIYKKQDIGKWKAEAALNNLEQHNINNSKIESHNLNIISNFSSIIELVNKCDTIFNMIDYGDSFDYLIQSLCLKLNKNLIQGGTFSHSLSIEVISTQDPCCLLCMNPSSQSFISLISPSNVLSISDASFLPQNINPISKSNVYLASQCASIMISLFVNKIIIKDSAALNIHRVLFYLNDLDILKFQIDKDPSCKFCHH